MASPSKYGRGLRRDSSRDKDILTSADLDVSRRSAMTAATDDLTDSPSPIPVEGDEGDNSTHQLRRRLSLMTDMASNPSPSNYRLRKQRLRQRLSNESLGDGVNPMNMSSPDESVEAKNKQADAAAARMNQMPDLDDESEFAGQESMPSQVKESIDRQQRREQAALEEVMSMVSKTKKKKSSKKKTSGKSPSRRSGAPSDRALLSPSRSGDVLDLGPPRGDMMESLQSPPRRTKSLNSRKPDRRIIAKGGRAAKVSSKTQKRRDVM